MIVPADQADGTVEQLAEFNPRKIGQIVDAQHTTAGNGQILIQA